MVSVYKITNTVNGKVYIGFTTKSVYKRWIVHRSVANTRPGCYIHRALRKYGESSFTVERLCFSPSVEIAKSMERLFIRLYRSHEREFGYNLTLGGDGAVHNDAVRKKLSEAMLRLGHRPPREACVKGGLSQKGHPPYPNQVRVVGARFRGKTFSENHRKRISEAKLGRQSPFKGVNRRSDISDEEIVDMYQSGQSCDAIARRLNTTRSTISWRLRKTGISMRPVGFPRKTKIGELPSQTQTPLPA